MLLIKLPFLPLRIVYALARFLGFSRFALFVIGIAVGLLFAPTTGAELRARLREMAEGRDPAPALPA